MNVMGIAVALVLAACWAAGVLWTAKGHTAVDAHKTPPPSVPATSAPIQPATDQHHGQHHAQRTRQVDAVATSAATTQPAGVAVGSTPAGSPTHQAAPTHHTQPSPPSSGIGHPSPSGHPTTHPSPGGTPSPSPTPSSGLLDGLIDHLHHLHP